MAWNFRYFCVLCCVCISIQKAYWNNNIKYSYDYFLVLISFYRDMYSADGWWWWLTVWILIRFFYLYALVKSMLFSCPWCMYKISHNLVGTFYFMAKRLFITWVRTQICNLNEGPKNHAYLMRYIQCNAPTIMFMLMGTLHWIHLAALYSLVPIWSKVSLLFLAAAPLCYILLAEKRN